MSPSICIEKDDILIAFHNNNPIDINQESLAQRLFVYGTIMLHQGIFIGEILSSFETHPIVKSILTSSEVIQDAHHLHDLILTISQEFSTEADEINQITKAFIVIGEGFNVTTLYEKLSLITDNFIQPSFSYSIDGGKRWIDV